MKCAMANICLHDEGEDELTNFMASMFKPPCANDTALSSPPLLGDNAPCCRDVVVVERKKLSRRG
jgi:hypothetical protein